jgi:hypothetical protein
MSGIYRSTHPERLLLQGASTHARGKLPSSESTHASGAGAHLVACCFCREGHVSGSCSLLWSLGALCAGSRLISQSPSFASMCVIDLTPILKSPGSVAPGIYLIDKSDERFERKARTDNLLGL